MDNRAQIPMPVVVLVFLGTVVAAALMYIFMDQAMSPMLDIATNASNTSESSRGLNEVAKPAWNNWAIWVLMGAMVLGVAGSAAARRGGR